MTTKTGADLTLFDTLSRLTFAQAAHLLGSEGKHLLAAGGQYDLDIDTQVKFDGREFRLEADGAKVVLRLDPAARSRLKWRCDTCDVPCEHAGAAFSLILEEKLALGLASAPPERTRVDNRSEDTLIAQAMAERRARASAEKMRLVAMDPQEIWTDYMLTNAASGKSYRVALRGSQPGESYCSCPDFRKNTLGTCKHILHALDKVRRKFPPAVRNRPYRRRSVEVHLAYGRELELRLLLPRQLDDAAAAIVRPIRDRPIADLTDLLKRIRRLEAAGCAVTVYPDAEEYIQTRLLQERIGATVAGIRRDPRMHPLRSALLKTELLPYQLDGIAFAAGAGRAVLADDMGLGKTVQGIGVAELLAREANIGKVLIVCPASVKSQWRSEIQRFSGRECQIVLGSAAERVAQYESPCFFTICNYEQVLRDILAIERAKWDLIILDEGQRIKNWEAKTTQTIKSLRSPFALVLSGTPLENRLDDLFSVVEFIDDRRLGPAFRFFHRHRVTDENGKVLGYKDLDQLRENLKPVLLRRTRGVVMRELPPRTTEIVRIAPTAEQLEIDGAQMQIVSTIVRKKYISEMDLLRLQKALLLARMNADSTYLVDKHEPGHSSKLDRLEELFESLLAEEGRKIVLFSEWTTMLGLIERRIARFGLDYVRLDGSVPQKKRQQLVHRFQRDPACRLFLTTNAGSTGLNLQAANTVINVDLPWNPAVLEQRIARAHRMGQKNPVQVFLLVTEDTIEEKLLATLSAKHDLARAALDLESDVREVALASGMEELKQRLEVLLGAKPHAAVDETQQHRQQQETERLARQSRVAQAGGQLLTAAFSFLSEMLPQGEPTQAMGKMAHDLKARLEDCLDRDEQGRPRLTVTLPDDAAIGKLAQSLAALLAE
ncbi:MAG TPA: DEAD/DEAH box helicase [Paraburkholderia sp.]|uniref:DEAD/DEAH box helicase n=1 Tax=Paraburkholderia sp. TaxID=1926495 RepID=UPI002B46BB00|nr:DEAD/DEAH box helicase [Paraburkholderia sp.]HKR41682.1 DEAD/DEAH box helicase [Paraburkholderia sp.]